jgi:hypothetical protein
MLVAIAQNTVKRDPIWLDVRSCVFRPHVCVLDIKYRTSFFGPNQNSYESFTRTHEVNKQVTSTSKFCHTTKIQPTNKNKQRLE